MAVCTFDNPNTFRRECWQDGRLICSYSASILPPYALKPIPGEHLFFGANIGDWKTGQLLGDATAIQSESSC
jgi:hypothetical protein